MGTPRGSALVANTVAERLEARGLKLAFGNVGAQAETRRALSMVIRGHRGRFDWLLHDTGRGQVLSLVSATPVPQVRDTRRAVDFGVVVDERQVLPLRFCKGAFHVGIVDARGLLVNGSVWMVCSPPLFWFKQP
jgi:hypothetical protein